MELSALLGNFVRPADKPTNYTTDKRTELVIGKFTSVLSTHPPALILIAISYQFMKLLLGYHSSLLFLIFHF